MNFLIEVPLLFFSIIAHEYAHGAVAERFGDDTARSMGRLTFNPVPHIDPVGTIVLPILCYLTNAPMFGWAKPVPVNPHLLNNKPASLFLVSAVGPLTNFFLACVGASGLWLIFHAFGEPARDPMLARILHYLVVVNLYLMVFNLLPIHPLDGSKVLESLLPYRWLRVYERLAPHGFLVILFLMWTGLLGRIISPVVYFLYHVLVRA